MKNLTMPNVVVDPEFATLLRPLSATEYDRLEQSIVPPTGVGLTSPLVLWRGHDILVDGHHRWSICKKHGIVPPVTYVALPDRDAVKARILELQNARRQCNWFERAEQAYKVLQPLFAAEARAQQGRKLPPSLKKLDTRGRMARLLDTSTGSWDKMKRLIESRHRGAERIRERLRGGEEGLSLSRATALLDDLENAEERLKSIQAGGGHLPADGDAISQKGDLWQLGPLGHVIVCGDSTKPRDVWRAVLRGDARVEPHDDWLRVLAGKAEGPADPSVRFRYASREPEDAVGRPVCLWTDPAWGTNEQPRHKGQLALENDTPKTMRQTVPRALQLANDVLEPGSPFYVCHPTGRLARDFLNAIHDVGWTIHQSLVWVKEHPETKRPMFVKGESDYHYAHETFAYGWTSGPGNKRRRGKSAPECRWHGGDRQATVFKYPRPKRDKRHVSSKPPELVRDMLLNSTRKGDVVYEPFLGSGSTLLACEMIGRTCVALEMKPEFVDYAIGRWMKQARSEDVVLFRSTKYASADGGDVELPGATMYELDRGHTADEPSALRDLFRGVTVDDLLELLSKVEPTRPRKSRKRRHGRPT